MQNKDNDVKKALRFLWMMWWASIAGSVIVTILCHLFADWAKWFPLINALELIRFGFPKPIILLFNTFLILSIIVCLRVRTMKTVQCFINRRKRFDIKESVEEDSVALDIYRRSVILSALSGVLMIVCGGAGFFLTRDYFVLYLFVFMGIVFLVINRPRQQEIEKVKKSIETRSSQGSITSEKKRRLGEKIRFAFLMLLLFPVTCTYLEYRNVDPEGACKGYKNFDLCSDAWFYQEHFSLLPTDDEMIEHFRKNRQKFESMKDDALVARGRKSEEMWVARYKAIVPTGTVYTFWPPGNYFAQEKYDPTRCWIFHSYPPSFEISGHHPTAFAFEVKSSMYINGVAYKDWPFVSHEKGYVYFLTPPVVGKNLVIVQKMETGSKCTWRLLDQLDGKWTEDLKMNEFVLRQIEPQWFLYISKDHIGG